MKLKNNKENVEIYDNNLLVGKIPNSIFELLKVYFKNYDKLEIISIFDKIFPPTTFFCNSFSVIAKFLPLIINRNSLFVFKVRLCIDLQSLLIFIATNIQFLHEL